jgi:hypothetical protein
LVRAKALEQIGSELQRKGLTEADLYRYAREVLFVNCWHVNSGDSAAMWSLYSGSAGVAVRSTVGRPRHALDGCAEVVTFGMVRYIDFQTYSAESLPEIRLSHLKRKSFEHERELRASISRHETCDGIRIPVDCNSVILDILVCPKSPDWLVAVVQDVVLKYGGATEVRKSDLYCLA